MKKTQERIRHISFIFSMCLFLFNFMACGIDNITVIDAPINNRNTPGYTNFYDLSYFEFETNEKNAASYTDCKFLGTEIYYKIYSDVSTMTSERDTLINLSLKDSTSAIAATTMMGSNYNYQRLRVTNSQKDVLIPSTGSDKIVYIRLTDYGDLSEYSSRVLIGGPNGTNLTGTSSVNQPIRILDDNLTFNFGRSSVNPDKNKIPVSGDPDVSISSSSSDGKWYVVLFAVGVGQDIITLTKIYSNILYLGEVTIDSNNPDN